MHKKDHVQGRPAKFSSCKMMRQKSAHAQRDESIFCNERHPFDKLDLQFLRDQMHSLLEQIGSLRCVLKDHVKANQLQSDELKHLRFVNEELVNVDRRLAYTRKKYQRTKDQNEESKKQHALDAKKNNELQDEVDNLKAQLAAMCRVVKEAEKRISEMNQYQLSLTKKDEDRAEEFKPNAVKENHISDLQKNQSSLVRKNDDMAAEISRLHGEMCNMEKLLSAEQDSRKNGQQQLFVDLQVARSSLLQRNDILSEEVAQLRTKLDSSVSFAKSVEKSQRSTSSLIGAFDNIENMDELSVETIRDVEGLRRAIAKLVPAYGHSLGDPKARDPKSEAIRNGPENELYAVRNSSFQHIRTDKPEATNSFAKESNACKEDELKRGGENFNIGFVTGKYQGELIVNDHRDGVEREKKEEAKQTSKFASSAKKENAFTLVEKPAQVGRDQKIRWGDVNPAWMGAEFISVAKGSRDAREQLQGKMSEAEDPLLAGRLQGGRMDLSDSVHGWPQVAPSPVYNNNKMDYEEIRETDEVDSSQSTKLGAENVLEMRPRAQYPSNDTAVCHVNVEKQMNLDCAKTFEVPEIRQFWTNTFSVKTGNTASVADKLDGKDHTFRILRESLPAFADKENLSEQLSLSPRKRTRGENWDETRVLVGDKNYLSVNTRIAFSVQDELDRNDRNPSRIFKESLPLAMSDEENRSNNELAPHTTLPRTMLQDDRNQTSNEPEVHSGAASFSRNEGKRSESQHSLFLIPEEINTNESSPLSPRTRQYGDSVLSLN